MKLLTTAEFAAIVNLHPKTVAKNAAALGGRKFGKEWRFQPDVFADVESSPREVACHSTDAKIPATGGVSSESQEEKRYAAVLARRIGTRRKNGTTASKLRSGANPASVIDLHAHGKRP